MIKDFVRKGEVIVTRGDIVWVKMGGNKIGSEQGGTRPAVVIQNDIGNKYKLRQLQENVVYDCYNIIPRRYKDRITKTLKRLEQEFVINVSIINFGTFIEPNKNEPIIEYKTDQYGDKHVEYRYKTIEDFRELTDEEDNLVQTIKNELLKKYECENIHERKG